jgi:hypothetical protein
MVRPPPPYSRTYGNLPVMSLKLNDLNNEKKTGFILLVNLLHYYFPREVHASIKYYDRIDCMYECFLSFECLIVGKPARALSHFGVIIDQCEFNNCQP